MTLTLSVLRCPDAVPPETRTVTGGEYSIGRGPDNDWPLMDPERVLSKRHCVLAFRQGGWQLADVSTNGTYLNRDADPIGQGTPRDLRDGDRLRLGSYEIEIRIIEEADSWQGSGHGGGQAASKSAFGDPFGDDPFAPSRPAARGFEQDALLSGRPAGGPASPGVMLPADYDPLAPDPFDKPFSGPTQSDHAPALEQAFRTPAPPSDINFDDWDLDLNPASAPPTAAPGATPPAPPPIATAAPALPAADDWDIDLSTPAPQATTPAPQAAPPPPPLPPAAPAAFAAPPPLPTAAPPTVAAPAAAPPVVTPPALADEADLPDPFAEPGRDAPPVAMPPSLPVAAPIAAAPTPPPAVARVTPPPLPQPGPPADPGDLMAAFLRGAGLEDARPADATLAMERLGAAFRALVGGLRQALIARASIKGEFRIEQTMIRARGNNPLKFSAGDDDALAALLGAGRRTDMSPAEAISEALTDMRLHELASMVAMQTAVRALVDRFDPAPLRAEGEQSGGMLGAQKRARAFELFEKLHGDTARALADDFDSVFGKTFARAYEQALREVSDKERPAR